MARYSEWLRAVRRGGKLTAIGNRGGRDMHRHHDLGGTPDGPVDTSTHDPALWEKRVVREPRAVLREFGLELPEDVIVRVHDSTADMRYMVLPRRPDGTEGWSEEALAAIVTRDCMLGAAVPRVTDAENVKSE